MTDSNLSNPQDLVDAALDDNPVVTPPTEPPIAPLIMTVPTPTPVPSMPIGDDTPLAFVTPSVTPNPPPTDLPLIVPPESTPKKSRKTLKVVLGVLLLVVGVVGGLVGYNYYYAQKQVPKIAQVGRCGYCVGEVCKKCHGEINLDDCSNDSECKNSGGGGGNNKSCNPKCDSSHECRKGKDNQFYCVVKEDDCNRYGQQSCEVPNPPYYTCCAKGYQCSPGVGCISKPKASKEPKPSPSPSVAPTIACTELIRTPLTTPVIGSVLTFTCAGAATPTSKVITYEFRSKIGSGAWTAMTNKTATTAKLTVALCGTYTIQCRACTMISGVKTCDPTWSAAQ